MTDIAIPHFVCHACSRKINWKPAIAGRRAKCGCGQILEVPSFAPTMPVIPTQSAAPVAGKKMSKSVMADIPRRKGLQAEAPPAPMPIPPVIRDVILPIALIVAGLYAAAHDAMQSAGSNAVLGNVIGPLILNIVVGLSLAVTAVLAGSAMAGIAFEGPIWQNVFKLCAVALLPLPMGAMAGRSFGGINGDIVASFVAIGFYFLLFWAVFKMAWSDRTVCVLLIWIIRSGVAYAMFKIMGEYHGNSI